MNDTCEGMNFTHLA